MEHQLEQWEHFSEEELVTYINRLILSDFSALVRLLYRLDVNESGLRIALAGHSAEDAGKIISGLIIERQRQKMTAKQQFKQSSNDISEEDRW